MRTLLTQKFCLVCNMQHLDLYDNQIGDTGMISLADALGKGALASLRELHLFQDAPAWKTLKAACQARGITFY
jgi:Ran GTPase-activating protein (RanGAP) involved in mRNA processing and transport